MRIDLFAHFTTQEFRQAYLSIPLGAKGRRLDPIAIRTFVQAQRTTDIDVCGIWSSGSGCWIGMALTCRCLPYRFPW